MTECNWEKENRKKLLPICEMKDCLGNFSIKQVRVNGRLRWICRYHLTLITSKANSIY